MAIGWLLRLDANAYLLVGVPLLLGFQWIIRRQPLASLWLRDSTAFRLDLPGMMVGVLLAVLPTIQLVSNISSAPWSLRLWARGGEAYAKLAQTIQIRSASPVAGGQQ